MDNKNLCKLCYNSNKQIINIFDENGIELNIAQILRNHFWFKIIENDCVSNVICTDCWWKTENFHKFYNEVKNAHINYLNISFKTNQLYKLKKKSIIKDIKSCNGDIKFTKAENFINVSDAICLKKIASDTIINENLTEEVSTVIKGEKQNFNSNISDSFIEKNAIDDSQGNYDSNIENYSTFNKNNKKLLNIGKKSKSKVKKKIISCRKDAKVNSTKTSKLVNKQNNKLKSVTSTSTDTKHNIKCETSLNALEKKLQTDKEDAQIREYFKMECEICNYKFVTYSDCKPHYREQHKIKGFIRCCKRKFVRRGAVLEHIIQHINPEAYKCHICNKCYSDKEQLSNHIRNHVSPDEKPYKCDICSKSFIKKCYLNGHKKQNHRITNEKKYSCDICGKSFLTKYYLTKHIRGIHENAFEQICDICARVCQNISVFKRHRNTHFNVDAIPKMQCNICGAWLHKYSLGAHLARHRDTKHNCPQCGKESANKHALNKHIKCVHSGKVHVCKLCNKEFKEAIGLKEHLASHTGEILYTCPHCPKTFTHSSNMHSHRKKVHPIEWLENRRKRVAEIPNL